MDSRRWNALWLLWLIVTYIIWGYNYQWRMMLASAIIGWIVLDLVDCVIEAIKKK